MLSYEKVLSRFKAAKQDKQLWESILRDCYDYAMPERNTIDVRMQGEKKMNKVFDSTAIDALEDYATRMGSLLVPSYSRWMVMEAGSDIPEEKQTELNKYLEVSNKELYQHINTSNFSSQIHEAFLDLAISTGAIIIEEGDGIQSGLNFRAVSLSEIYPERSQRGIIETVFREMKIPVKDIQDFWPKAKLTESMIDLLDKKPETEFDLLEAVVEQKGKYYTILSCFTSKAFLLEEEIDYNPWVVFRESTLPGETLGRGRVMRVLNDIKTLNKMKEDYLRALSFQANPIFTATDDGVINPYTVKMKPGVTMPVGSNDNVNPTLRALQLSGNPQLLDFEIKSLQDSIRRTLLSKPFGNIEETPVRTATEMSIRNADHAQISIGASSRIQVELLERVVKNSVHILKKQGKIAEFKIDGREVKLKFVNPASRQQEESKLAAYGRFLEFAAAAPQYAERAIEMEELPADIWDALGLPADRKRTDAEKQQYDAKIAQQQQALTEAQGGRA